MAPNPIAHGSEPNYGGYPADWAADRCDTCQHRKPYHFRGERECAFVNDEQDPCRCQLYMTPATDERVTIKDLTTYVTDHERGRLLELWAGSVQAMVDVRSQVKDTALRELLIAELERLGYTVTPPTPYPGPFIP